ncbi:MAG: GNAT family N-acetyltransferase [Gaiellaceae bacterium]
MREVEPSEWDGVLEELEVADAYYRRAYVESACVLEPGRTLLLEHEGTVFAGIIRGVEIVPEPRRSPAAADVVTPYGYGGPAGGGTAGFWPAYDAWCREQGVVTTFVRFHPLYGNQYGAAVHVEPLASTIGWGLKAGDLLAGMHPKHRNAARKAEGAGVTVEAVTGLGGFVPLYEESMRRAGAAAFYFFPPVYWEALERLGDGLARFDALADEEVVASALCLASPPWLHYHLGATSEAGRRFGATTLLLLEAARWAQQGGYAVFHLGGGVGGARDSLHEFKRRFDPSGEREAAVGKAVHDADAYRAVGGDPADLSGFFPAYGLPR